jgi:hypothetical protein
MIPPRQYNPGSPAIFCGVTKAVRCFISLVCPSLILPPSI